MVDPSAPASQIAEVAIALAEHASEALIAQQQLAIPQNTSVFVANSIQSSPTVAKSPDHTRQRTVEPSCFQSSVQMLVPQVPENYVLPSVPPLPSGSSGSSGQPAPVDLMAQMKKMMEEVLDQKLAAQNSELSSAFQVSLDAVKSDLNAETVARVAAQQKTDERLAALEALSSSQAARAFFRKALFARTLAFVLLVASTNS